MLKGISVRYFQELIKSITARKHKKCKINNQIIWFQAYARGYLLRKKLSNRFTYFYNNVDKIIRIQAWWRSIVQRKQYEKLLEDKKKYNEKKSQNTSLKVETKYANILDYYRKHVNDPFLFCYNFIYDALRVELVYLIYYTF